jgi:hypothetical protein
MGEIMELERPLTICAGSTAPDGRKESEGCFDMVMLLYLICVCFVPVSVSAKGAWI